MRLSPARGCNMPGMPASALRLSLRDHETGSDALLPELAPQARLAAKPRVQEAAVRGRTMREPSPRSTRPVASRRDPTRPNRAAPPGLARPGHFLGAGLCPCPWASCRVEVGSHEKFSRFSCRCTGWASPAVAGVEPSRIVPKRHPGRVRNELGGAGCRCNPQGVRRRWSGCARAGRVCSHRCALHRLDRDGVHGTRRPLRGVGPPERLQSVPPGRGLVPR